MGRRTGSRGSRHRFRRSRPGKDPAQRMRRRWSGQPAGCGEILPPQSRTEWFPGDRRRFPHSSTADDRPPPHWPQAARHGSGARYLLAPARCTAHRCKSSQTAPTRHRRPCLPCSTPLPVPDSTFGAVHPAGEPAGNRRPASCRLPPGTRPADTRQHPGQRRLHGWLPHPEEPDNPPPAGQRPRVYPPQQRQELPARYQ